MPTSDYRQSHSEHFTEGIRYWQSGLLTAYDIVHGFLGADADMQNEQQKIHAENVFFKKVDQLVHLHQVHGATLFSVADRKQTMESLPEADGAYCDIKDRAQQQALCIRTADCAPVLLASFCGRFVAALHCGWRSAAAGILPAAVAKAQSLGYRAEDLLLSVGPCAGPCCYEVGTEFCKHILQVEKNIPTDPDISLERQGRIYFDLPLFLLLQAESVGLPASQLSLISICTICDDRFFSYRRQKTDSGRQLSFICNIAAK